MRAQRAEALNRWIEESIDAQHEPVDFDSMAEAAAAESEMGTFRAELADKRDESASLKALRADMDAAGGGPNPYSRFQVADIEAGLGEAELAATERDANIAKARERIAVLDAQKKEFAQLAEDVLAFARNEKAALEVQEQAVGTIHPDDAESILRGKEALAQVRPPAPPPPPWAPFRSHGFHGLPWPSPPPSDAARRRARSSTSTLARRRIARRCSPHPRR